MHAVLPDQLQQMGAANPRAARLCIPDQGQIMTHTSGAQHKAAEVAVNSTLVLVGRGMLLVMGLSHMCALLSVLCARCLIRHCGSVTHIQTLTLTHTDAHTHKHTNAHTHSLSLSISSFLFLSLFLCFSAQCGGVSSRSVVAIVGLLLSASVTSLSP